jgi:hypothetical protein
MFERYTEAARQALFFAQDEVSQLGDSVIGEPKLPWLLRNPVCTNMNAARLPRLENDVRVSLLLFVLALACVPACGGHRPIWHDQKLLSGRTVKVTSFNLVWGVEHDERDTTKDCFALEYVSGDPQADPRRREAEATEVFELIRPVSEQWGFQTASIAGFPTVERKGKYDLYWFERKADGRWSFTRSEMKVFVND